MNEKLEVAIKFCEKTIESSASFHKRGDDAVKFYIGAGAALAAWLLTNTPNSPIAAFTVLALGVFGAGRVCYYLTEGLSYCREPAKRRRLLLI